ncbi:hypothetical protein Hanom_Chr06g00564491 [Helianthus anomalus]
MIDEMVTVNVTNAVTNNKPMYIVVIHAKKIAKKPPTAAKEMRREITIAFTVAARNTTVNTSIPKQPEERESDYRESTEQPHAACSPSPYETSEPPQRTTS